MYACFTCCVPHLVLIKMKFQELGCPHATAKNEDQINQFG